MSATVPEKSRTVENGNRGTSQLCEIPFDVVSQSESKLRSVPMTNGLCIPRGKVFDAGEWVVEGLGGAHFPAQTEILNRWSDGSVRWMLMHFVAGRVLPGRTSCALVRHKQRPSSGTSSMRWDNQRIIVQTKNGQPEQSTGSMITITLTPELLDATGTPLQLDIADVRASSCNLSEPSRIEKESSGAVRCVSVLEATVRGLPFVTLQFRVETWPTTGHVRVDTRIRNTRRAQHKGGLWDLGDTGSVLLSGLHLKIKRADLELSGGRWKAEQDQPAKELTGDLQIVQVGSGSAQWDSTNHVDAQENSTVAGRGYFVSSDAGEFQGDRSEPVVALTHDEKTLTVAVPEFWQQFPSSLGVSGGVITAGLFAAAAGQSIELQGGEQKTHTVWISTGPSNEELDHLAWTDQAPRVIQSANWFQRCQVFPWFPESTRESRLENYLREATSGDYTFDARRERIDEYGWRNFGDVPADHEQTHYDGEDTIISHYNNQFDLIFGGILNLTVTGNPAWYDLFHPLARHVMDIDIYHTSEDRAVFNGGLFWHTDHYVAAKTATHRTYSVKNAEDSSYGGGLCCEHNYTTGLMYYHFLTGSVEARESVRTLADWVLNMEDGSTTIWGLLDSGDTGLASATVFENFHGPGRGVGNSINSLVDAWILTQDNKYIAKAEQLIHRVVHPTQSCDELHLIDAEGHWSYTVCMTAIGRYLVAKLEADQVDEHYEYARQSLVNYGIWMAANEKPTLSRPETLDYVTEAWAAQDFRKANALRIAASCTDDADAELQMRQRADELNDAAWKDLYQFDDNHLTARCLSILMTEGLRDVFHRSNRPEYFPPADIQLPETEWTMFVPQKLRVKQLLKNPLQLAKVSLQLLNPGRWRKTIDALRRQLH